MDQRYKHGFSPAGKRTPTYRTWHSMKQRCTNPNEPNYKNYGAKGVTVCDKWLDFSGFLEDMGARPDGLTLDRIDNTKGYSKENCRWATMGEQQRNKPGWNIYVEYNGETLCVSELARKLNMHVSTLYNRLRRGWSVDRAVQPVSKTI